MMVGRDRELARVRLLVDDALAGRGRLVLDGAAVLVVEDATGLADGIAVKLRDVGTAVDLRTLRRRREPRP